VIPIGPICGSVDRSAVVDLIGQILKESTGSGTSISRTSPGYRCAYDAEPYTDPDGQYSLPRRFIVSVDGSPRTPADLAAIRDRLDASGACAPLAVSGLGPDSFARSCRYEDGRAQVVTAALLGEALLGCVLERPYNEVDDSLATRVPAVCRDIAERAADG